MKGGLIVGLWLAGLWLLWACLAEILPAHQAEAPAESASDDWLQRSEKVCGPGYLIMGTSAQGDHHKYCIAYKLPDQK